MNWDSQPGVPRPGWARDPAWRHGEEGEHLLVRTTADGRQRIVRVSRPGDVLGLEALATARYDTEAVALGPSR